MELNIELYFRSETNGPNRFLWQSVKKCLTEKNRIRQNYQMGCKQMC